MKNWRNPAIALSTLAFIAFVQGCPDEGEEPTPDAADGDEDREPTAEERYGQPFEGTIAEGYEDSEEWWPPRPHPDEDAPNVLLILLDDTGFAHFGSFGGQIDTPNMDAIAEQGLRYNNFHTTALCSPTRASLMAGRNPHRIGLGSHSLTAMGFPGYNAMIPPSAQSGAKVMQEAGYGTYAIGKWDHTPLYEVSLVGPHHAWPTSEGFNHFYGFMSADVDNWHSVMWEDQHATEPWHDDDDYHLSTDMADRAVEWVTGHESIDPDRPWFLFWAPGAMHSPHHAPESYIEKYRGKFDAGWDAAREEILARQIEIGIVPEGTELSTRPDVIPAWDTLSDDEKRLYARQMEVFAAQLEHVDHEIGRMLAMLDRIGARDDTMIIVTSDNGASGEGGLTGSFNETYVLNGIQTPLDANLQHIDHWGGPDTYPHYHAGWAMAGNTPFKYFKQTVHRGGQSDALIVSWPSGIAARGEIRYETARRALQRFAPESRWLALLAEPSGSVPDQMESEFVEIGETRESPVPFDEEAIASALADEARGRRHFPDYRVREGQIRLARRFVRNLADEEILLMEGGTGIGKSLAYLVPSVLWAVENAAPVVVSTNTKNLQRQLYDKDLPLLSRSMGVDFSMSSFVSLIAKSWSRVSICGNASSNAICQGWLGSKA